MTQANTESTQQPRERMTTITVGHRRVRVTESPIPLTAQPAPDHVRVRLRAAALGRVVVAPFHWYEPASTSRRFRQVRFDAKHREHDIPASAVEQVLARVVRLRGQVVHALEVAPSETQQ